MQHLLYLLALTVLLGACRSKTNTETALPTTNRGHDSIPTASITSPNPETTDSLSEEESVDYAWFQIVIVDTSDRYDALLQTLRNIEKKYGLEVDLMGRYYDKKKQLICLPENDEDELYAGSYFPRRFPGNTLSIEYLNTYIPERNDQTMALVARIATERTEADSLVNVLKTNHPHTHALSAKVFIGCLH